MSDVFDDFNKDDLKFFMGLDDASKVYALHDYIFDEFESDIDGDLDDDINKIDVIVINDTLIIKSEDESYIESTMTTMMLNGWILNFLRKKDDVLIYKVVGMGKPISQN